MTTLITTIPVRNGGRGTSPYRTHSIFRPYYIINILEIKPLRPAPFSVPRGLLLNIYQYLYPNFSEQFLP